MKKLFVSIPLKGRSKEDIEDSIERIKGAAEELLDEKVEVLHQDVKDLPDFDKDEDGYEENLEFLAEDVKLMSEADYFATIECNYDFRHCYLEEEIFRRYRGKDYETSKDIMFKFSTNVVAPDIIKKERELAKKIWGEKALKEEPIETEKEAFEEKENQD